MHSILAAQTDFSVGKSIISVKRLVEQAKLLGETAVAVTDDMSVTSLMDFTSRAKKEDIKPIIGTRLRLVDDPAWRAEKGDKKGKKGLPQYYATAYALTEAGMKALFRLLTLGNSKDRFFFVSRLSFEDLLKELALLAPGDIAMTLGDAQGVITHPNANIITELSQALPDHLYASLVPVDTPYFARINELSLDVIAAGLAKPLVVRPAFYEKDQPDAHEIMGAVVNNNKLTDGWHKSAHNRDFHLMNAKDLVEQVKIAANRITQRGNAAAGRIFAEGLKNTDELVDRVKYEWSKAPVSLPKMAPDEFAAVKAAAAAGWKSRFTKPVFGHQPTKQELDTVYLDRLKYELSILKKFDFSGYFLLVQDVVQYAKSNGIIVGPGRGSVGGSLVAYLMGITDCDPIRFDLMFERFINPDRIDLPDVDLDFQSARRNEIFEYLTTKYGANHVAGVSNFMALAPTSSIKDISKAVGLPEKEYICSRFVPKKHGAHVPLPECVEKVDEIRAFSEKYEGWWTIMERLEGTMRSYGRHAAGVVVSAVELTDRAVIEVRKDEYAVNWDKRMVEDQGLVKMDILGLNTLDVTKLVLDFIRERSGQVIDLTEIPLDDEPTLKNFAAGMTNGVFQFDGGGMKSLLRNLGSTGDMRFDDVVAAVALYRPGPMESGMMESYYLRKQGNEAISYPHPLMEPILRPTFGVMVFQEQVMQVARTIAGYTGGDADKLRKIMGKKLPEDMKKERGKFVSGCVKTIACTEQWADALFDDIAGWAGYGFNKAHSITYAMLAYETMWLKTNYPVEFLAAALSLMSEEKLPSIIRDAKVLGVDVSMPDINISSDRFEIATAARLVIPLLRIKGISHNTTNAVIDARKAGPFLDKADFLARVNKTKCNIGHQTKLDLVGAFSRIEPGQVPADDPSRIKDQMELIPGLITANVPVNRDMHTDDVTKEAIQDVVRDYSTTHGTKGTQDGAMVNPKFSKKGRFMIIQDCPGRDEDQAGQMGPQPSGQNQGVANILIAMEEVGLDKKDAYWTALIKRMKSDKQVSAEEIERYVPYLMEEIKILAPPVIVLMGTSTVRHFVPDFKGRASDQAGKIIYSKALDANIVIGFNIGELHYAPEKIEQAVEVFAAVADLLV